MGHGSTYFSTTSKGRFGAECSHQCITGWECFSPRDTQSFLVNHRVVLSSIVVPPHAANPAVQPKSRQTGGYTLQGGVAFVSVVPETLKQAAIALRAWWKTFLDSINFTGLRLTLSIAQWTETRGRQLGRDFQMQYGELGTALSTLTHGNTPNRLNDRERKRSLTPDADRKKKRERRSQALKRSSPST
ncbi:hypothetical protein CIHG_04697 [Coccidioides immitis H538.4]|uniref:Uncharacterized protein n=3 Tax=Coccidioides immitis TaxID=5501 RepID=A0A0J8QIL9_COCIT|nr:hypothetical protein CIRG_08118 [Coccidioides immitis RMSCC 2394]KMU72306.1 hypothetical protein CISG_02955 [Coccidioides immitis RMSCC 3703]KMU87252.1 hypothetical protein CIHG_04697 [Coccidioides immitis H538.4]